MANNRSNFDGGTGKSPFKGKVGDANLSAEDFNSLSPEEQKKHISILTGAASPTPETDASAAEVEGAQNFLKGKKGYQGKVRVKVLPDGGVSANGKAPATKEKINKKIDKAVNDAAGLPSIPEPTYSGEGFESPAAHRKFFELFRGVRPELVDQARANGLFRKHARNEQEEEKFYRRALSQRYAGLSSKYDPTDDAVQEKAKAAYEKVKPAEEDSIADPSSSTSATGFLHPNVPILSRDYFDDLHKQINVVDNHLDEVNESSQSKIGRHLTMARESLNSAMIAHPNGRIFDENPNYDTTNIRGRGRDSQTKIELAKKGSISHMHDAYTHLLNASNELRLNHEGYKNNEGHLAVATLGQLAVNNYDKEARLATVKGPRNIERGTADALAEAQQKQTEYNLTRSQNRKGTATTTPSGPYVAETNDAGNSQVRFGLGAKFSSSMTAGHTPTSNSQTNLPSDYVEARAQNIENMRARARANEEANKSSSTVVSPVIRNTGIRNSESREQRNARLTAEDEAAKTKQNIFAEAESDRRTTKDADLTRKISLYERLGHFDKAAIARTQLSTYKPKDGITSGAGALKGAKVVTDFGSRLQTPEEETTSAVSSVAKAHWHSVNTPEGSDIHNQLKSLDAEQDQGLSKIQEKYGSLPKIEGTAKPDLRNPSSTDWNHPDSRAYLNEVGAHTASIEARRKAIYGTTLVRSYRAMSANPEKYLEKNRIAQPTTLEQVPDIASKVNQAPEETKLQFGVRVNAPRPPK